MSWDIMLIKTATNAEPMECMDGYEYNSVCCE